MHERGAKRSGPAGRAAANSGIVDGSRLRRKFQLFAAQFDFEIINHAPHTRNLSGDAQRLP